MGKAIFEDDTYIDGILYVPKGTIEKYQTNALFSKFFHIQEFDETNINSVSLDTADLTIFDMQGNHIYNLRKGLNIILEKRGKTKKVIIR